MQALLKHVLNLLETGWMTINVAHAAEGYSSFALLPPERWRGRAGLLLTEGEATGNYMALPPQATVLPCSCS